MSNFGCDMNTITLNIGFELTESCKLKLVFKNDKILFENQKLIYEINTQLIENRKAELRNAIVDKFADRIVICD